MSKIKEFFANLPTSLAKFYNEKTAPNVGGCFVVSPNMTKKTVETTKEEGERVLRYKDGTESPGEHAVVFFYKENDGESYQRALLKAAAKATVLSEAFKAMVAAEQSASAK